MIDFNRYQKHLDQILDFNSPVCLICLTSIFPNEVAIQLVESVLGENVQETVEEDSLQRFDQDCTICKVPWNGGYLFTSTTRMPVSSSS
ncbi:hypothetical protein ApAK_07605 [Thermoplasmatales archaeon AK]|nr:hypothetical protein [Thermoplasmatales archaeon AK]